MSNNEQVMFPRYRCSIMVIRSHTFVLARRRSSIYAEMLYHVLHCVASPFMSMHVHCNAI